jgi:quercetin dioxygenase-like cupin family protein
MVQYPEQAAAIGYRLRGRHIFHQDVCIGCTLCERVRLVIANHDGDPQRSGHPHDRRQPLAGTDHYRCHYHPHDGPLPFFHHQGAPMPHIAVANATSAVSIQPGAIVSKVIHRDDQVNATVFGLDAGEELTEHQASSAAIVQVLAGRLRFTADGEAFDAGPGFWLHLAPKTPHTLVAVEPAVMLVTLVRR